MSMYLIFFGKAQSFKFYAFDKEKYIEDFNTVIRDFDLLESQVFTIDNADNQPILAKYNFKQNGTSYSLLKLYSFAQAYSGDRVYGSIYGVAILSNKDLPFDKNNIKGLEAIKKAFTEDCLDGLKFKTSDFLEDVKAIWEDFKNDKEIGGFSYFKLGKEKPLVIENSIPHAYCIPSMEYDLSSELDDKIKETSRIYISTDIEHLKRTHAKLGDGFPLYIPSENGKKPKKKKGNSDQSNQKEKKPTFALYKESQVSITTEIATSQENREKKSETDEDAMGGNKIIKRIKKLLSCKDTSETELERERRNENPKNESNYEAEYKKLLQKYKTLTKVAIWGWVLLLLACACLAGMFYFYSTQNPVEKDAKETITEEKEQTSQQENIPPRQQDAVVNKVTKFNITCPNNQIKEKYDFKPKITQVGDTYKKKDIIWDYPTEIVDISDGVLSVINQPEIDKKVTITASIKGTAHKCSCSVCIKGKERVNDTEAEQINPAQNATPRNEGTNDTGATSFKIKNVEGKEINDFTIGVEKTEKICAVPASREVTWNAIENRQKKKLSIKNLGNNCVEVTANAKGTYSLKVQRVGCEPKTITVYVN